MKNLRRIMAETTARYKRQTNIRAKRRWHLENYGKGGDLLAIDEPQRIQQRISQFTGEAPAARVLAAPITRDEDTTVDFLERILLEDNIIGVSFLINGAQAARSVGRIVIRDKNGLLVGYGTGFMVSKKLMMTNNHVLPDREAAEHSVVQFNYYETRPQHPTTPIEFELDPDTFFITDKSLDFSLL